MQKRTAWPRADYLISKPRFKRIGELRVGKLRITLQFLGSPGVDRMQRNWILIMNFDWRGS